MTSKERIEIIKLQEKLETLKDKMGKIYCNQIYSDKQIEKCLNVFEDACDILKKQLI